MTEVEPTITVVIPVYNGANHLDQTLSSLFEQDEPVSQVVVVDDGSTDGSAEIARRHPLAPEVIQQTNRGVAAARNIGVAAATGDYVALLDQDDLWMRSRHARLRLALTADPSLDVVVTTCTSFYLAEDEPALVEVGDQLHLHHRRVEAGRSPLDLTIDLPPQMPAPARCVTSLELLAGPPSVTASLVIRRATLQAAGGFPLFARSYDDYAALLNLSIIVRVVLLDEPTLLYRIHPGSTTMRTDWPLPLLTGLMAIRHGSNLVARGQGRTPGLVPPLLDDRRFVLHQLIGLAGQSMGGLLDSWAVIRLLGTSAADRRRAATAVLRPWAAGIRRRAGGGR